VPAEKLALMHPACLSNRDNRSLSIPRVTFVGPLPPPVTGMTAMTDVIVRALAAAGPMTCFNWSCGKPLKGIRWKIARFWGAVRSFFGLLLRGRRPGKPLYYLANSSWGMAYDFVLLGLGRLLGYRIVLHHHAYSYLDQYDWRMALVNRLVGSRGAHAVHCQKMVDDFLAQYNTAATFLIVPPTIVSSEMSLPKDAPSRENSPDRPFVLGFLSNLTIAKGLHLVLDTFEELASRDDKVRLILAGPCYQKEATALVEQALARWPKRVEYRGPVYGNDKTAFFSAIDTFLFPTQYRNESWGIVLTEAMSIGCPVIAYDRGCVSHIIRDGCGLVVARDDDFVTEAAGLISQWIDNKELHEQACQQALTRNEQLERESDEQLAQFVESLRELSD